jgi:heat shock protein HtpX
MITWLLLGGQLMSGRITLIIYTISLTVAYSPIGEYILRFINKVRKLETNREKEYLIPLFEDVYNQTKEIYPRLNRHIEIYIIDALHINSMAIGRKTIAVTKGAVEAFTDDELKGIIAHEMGHIVNGHTKAILLTTVGNGIFTALILILKLLVGILNFLLDVISRKNKIINILVFIIKGVVSMVLAGLLLLIQLMIAVNSRTNNYSADKFACELGFGDDLLSGLYTMQEICISDKTTLIDKLKDDKPHIAKRIGRLEKIIDSIAE